MKFEKMLYSKKFFIANLIALGVIIGFVFAFIGGRSLMLNQNKTALPVVQAETPSVQVSPEIGAALSQAESIQTAFRYVAKTVLPSVVELDVVDKPETSPKTAPSIPFEFFFGPQDNQDNQQGQTPYQQEGLGSGVIFRRDGNTVYVLTNNHVAGNADKITVVLNDGREFSGNLVGADDRKDIAVVKFETSDKDITVAKLGDSSKLEVGDWAIALGSPFGLVSSVTTGIISALGRNGGPDGNINDFIQTDAAINKGNSGGALVNIRGEVIGINTWIASPTGGSVGLGFAIPINNIKNSLDDLITKKQIQYGWLGISMLNIGQDKATARELGIDGKKGAFVAQVFYNGPADKGGLLPGDFITSVNGQSIKSQDELVRIIGDIKPGSTATIEFVRNGSVGSAKVKIDLRDKNIASNNKDLYPGLSILSLASDNLQKDKLSKGAKEGVFVTDVIAKSPASIMGVKPGDIIVKVNDKAVKNSADFYRLINDPKEKKLIFTIVRDDQTLDTLAFNKK